MIDCLNETISCFSLTLKGMSLGKTLSDSLFNSVNLNFLRTEALSFYKVPFVVCFCTRLLLTQDRLPFVQYNGGALSRCPPSTPQTSPPLSLSPVPFHNGAQPQQPVPRETDTIQGRLQTTGYHNPLNYGPKEARKNACEEDNHLLRGPFSLTFSNITCQRRDALITCETVFIHVGVL